MDIKPIPLIDRYDEWRAFLLGAKAGEFDLPDGAQ